MSCSNIDPYSQTSWYKMKSKKKARPKTAPAPKPKPPPVEPVQDKENEVARPISVRREGGTMIW